MNALDTIREQFVEIDESLPSWMFLLSVIAVLLAIDLFRHRDDHEPSTREALLESIAWVVCGLSFALFVGVAFGGQAVGEYLSGYLIEKSLSIDNVFVWALVFSTLGIPVRYQHRVLFWGIFGALVLRAAFIVAGTAAISRFDWVLILFGVFLVYTGIRVVRHRAEEGSGAAKAMAIVQRVIPVSPEFDGHKFFSKKTGRRVATPLLAALIVVELTDIVFAVDSVPAILAVSQEPYLVFASNAFAILGLRAMYFLLATARSRFHYLSHGLGAVLVFVGVKMIIAEWYHFDTYVSLGIITVILGAAMLFSERKNRQLVREGRRSGGVEHPPHAESRDVE
jgi:tellurite resistance protein TerC